MRRVSRRQAQRNRASHLLVMQGGALFREATLGESCVVCGTLDGVQSHHAVSKQRLRRLGLVRYMWCPLNAVPLCKRDHERETTAHRRVTRVELPARVFEFVVLVLEETGVDLGIYLPQEEAAA